MCSGKMRRYMGRTPVAEGSRLVWILTLKHEKAWGANGLDALVVHAVNDEELGVGGITQCRS